MQLKKRETLWGLILSTHLGDQGVAEWNNKDMGLNPKFLRDQALLVYILTHTRNCSNFPTDLYSLYIVLEEIMTFHICSDISFVF